MLGRNWRPRSSISNADAEMSNALYQIVEMKEMKMGVCDEHNQSLRMVDSENETCR